MPSVPSYNAVPQNAMDLVLYYLGFISAVAGQVCACVRVAQDLDCVHALKTALLTIDICLVCVITVDRCRRCGRSV